LPEISLRQMKEQSGADAEIAKQLQNALRSYLSEKLETDSFAEKALVALTSESAKRTARRVNVFGAIKNFVLVGSDNAGENRIYRYRVEMPARLMLWRFAVDKNGKISEMALEEEE
jgi:hypothetical protein